MASTIKLSSSIILIFCFLLLSCEESAKQDNPFHSIHPATDPLMNYAFVDALDEAPVNFPEAWNRESLRKAGIKKITMYSRGGKSPDDTLEQFVLDYQKDWSVLHYKGYKLDESRDAWTSGTIIHKKNDLSGEILFTKHFGIKKLLKTSISKIPDGYLLLRSKTGNRFDTTWLTGTLDRPKALISKIGRTLFSIDLYLPEGSSTQQIVNAFHRLPFSEEVIAGTQCTVIFTRKGRPQTAFLLNEQFSQVAKTRSWTYTKDFRIATYKEWIGSSVIKDMSWEYGSSSLPERLIINRKMYFYHYE